MTDLLERYLGAIRKELPDDQKEDVTAELRDVLLSQVEDREAGLGRPLTREETAGLLKAFGHPLVVAGRYRRFNRLIGPEVFPFYWFWLKTLLSIAVVVHLIVGAVLIAGADEPGQAVGQLVGRLIATAVSVVGWTTLAFVAVEQSGAIGKLMRWDPRRLPLAMQPLRKPRFDLALEIGLSILFIAWWGGWLEWGWFADRERSVVIAGGPMREALHWPVLALAAAGIGVSALELARPDWSRPAAGLSFVWHLTALGLVVAYLAGEGPRVVVSGALPAEQIDRIAHGVGAALYIGLIALGVVLALAAAKDAWWLLSGGAPWPPRTRLTRWRRQGPRRPAPPAR